MDKMKPLIDIIQTIVSGVKSPVKAAIGAVFALFLYFFISIKKGEFRVKQADKEKEDQKDESNTELENSNSETDRSVRDQLRHKYIPNDI